MEKLDSIAVRLEKAVEETSALAAESRLKFDAMVEMQSDERLKMQEMFLKEKQDLLTHFEQSDKRKNKIIIGLIIALVVLIGGIVGGAFYVLSTFDIGVFSQDVQADGSSTAIIYDGITYTKE